MFQRQVWTMILRELLSKVNLNQLSKEYLKIYDDYSKHKKKRVKKNLAVMTESLKEIIPVETDVQEISVCRYVDYYGDEPQFGYDVFCTLKNSDDHFAFEDIDWAKLIEANVNDKSIERYGKYPVIANILYTMSWHGYDYDTARKNQQKFLKELVDLKENTEKNDSYVPYKDVVKELGLSISETEIEELNSLSKIFAQFYAFELKQIGYVRGKKNETLKTVSKISDEETHSS